MAATTPTRGAPLPPAPDPGRPRHRVALAGVLAATAVLSGWNAAAVGFAPYYASGAVSMSRTLRALLFGTVDPAGTLTLDKLAGFLVPQALSVAVFGVHAWSLALPQVVEGVVTVWAGYRIGLRWKSRTHGLVVAGLLALTPILVATDGRPTEDAMVAMWVALAFAAVLAALQERRPGLLVLAGVWVGLGFQAKMLAAWLILPAIVVTAVLGRPPRARRWAAWIAVALLACAVVSLLWPAVVAALPGSARPFVDGTSDDDPFSMVFGYNGVDRLLPHAVPGALPQLHGAEPFTNATRTGAAGSSPLKLLLPRLTTQIGWLYPTALAGAVVALVSVRRRAASRAALRPEDAATVGLATWLLVAGGVLSAGFMPHASYLTLIAVPIAAFAARGLVWAVTAHRAGGSARRRAALPVLVLVQTVWAALVLAQSAAQVRPLVVVLAAAGAAAIVALDVVQRRRSGAARGPLALALVAVLLPTLIWSAFPLASGGGGSASDPYAGPTADASSRVPLLALGSGPGLLRIRRPLAGFRSGPPAIGREGAQLLRAVRAAPGRSDGIPFATDSLPLVVQTVLATRLSPLPMGGYSGNAPFPTTSRLRALVQEGRLRWIVLRAGAGTGALGRDRAWVRTRCRPAGSGHWVAHSRASQTLWDCRPADGGRAA